MIGPAFAREPNMMKLSVLDQSVAVSGQSEDNAIRGTVTLAQQCEALGYHRFWVSEHHGLPTIVGSAPEVLMAAIAVRTCRIRIGSAGVMLPHYAALKVAEQFRVLDALAPGRIDMGVGRAPGGDMRAARALNPNASAAADDFPEQVADLRAWSEGRPHRGITAHPTPPAQGNAHGRYDRVPDLWILGSSDYGAQLAAAYGLPYAFAYFFMDGQGVEQALALYRSLYRPSERYPAPCATICVWALAAETDAQAHHQALSRDRWRLDRLRGRIGPLQPPDLVAERGFDAEEQMATAGWRDKALVGTAAEVANRLRALAQTLGLDEIVVNTWAHDPAVRLQSYALLAREFKLTPPTSLSSTSPTPWN
jgi:luciferase family oxidoreductase group 1